MLEDPFVVDEETLEVLPRHRVPRQHTFKLEAAHRIGSFSHTQSEVKNVQEECWKPVKPSNAKRQEFEEKGPCPEVPPEEIEAKVESQNDDQPLQTPTTGWTLVKPRTIPDIPTFDTPVDPSMCHKTAPTSLPEEEEDEEMEEMNLIANNGLRVVICVQGWLWRRSEVVTMWVPVREVDPSAEVYSLRWETEALQELGFCLVKTIATTLACQIAKYVLIALSALAASLLAALAIPLTVMMVATALDNPWTVVRARAKKVGRMLADTLVERVHGERPVTLIGVSLGAQVVLSCLKRLIQLQGEGKNVHGILENVFLLGGACSSDSVTWSAIRPLVAGRVVNAYCKTDWILGLVHRAAGLTARPAGLEMIKCPAIENIDVTPHIFGHLSYKNALPKLLKIIEIQRSRSQEAE